MTQSSDFELHILSFLVVIVRLACLGSFEGFGKDFLLALDLLGVALRYLSQSRVPGPRQPSMFGLNSIRDSAGATLVTLWRAELQEN